jgi:SAM-dependent methyltransferase
MLALRRLAACGLFLCLNGLAAAQEEVPFITTPDQVTLAMLELARVGPGDHVIDLGSGDGRIPITAARRFGASGLGVEIVPDLVAKSRANAQAAGVAARVEFREQDLFRTELARASVVTMYLLPEVNLQLRPLLLGLAPGTRVVSHDWDLGAWQPDRTVRVDVPDKKVGLEKFSRVHLWVVPARVEGRWCGQDAARGATLAVFQAFQQVDAVLDNGSERSTRQGRIEGRRMALGELELDADGAALQVRRSPSARWDGARFTRCR